MDNATKPDVGSVAALPQGDPPRPDAARAVDGAAPGKPLAEPALRALAEAAARREQADRKAAAIASSPELNGRGGLDPVRYSDWEIAGRAVDF